MKKSKIVVVVGPTASGKSSLAVHLAKKFNGEVISADSRQIYKGLDVGSNKITPKEAEEVPHHLIDIKKVGEDFSVAEYKAIAEEKIKEILERRGLPIVAGGTGFYIDALVYGKVFPEVPPDEELRSRLEKLSVEELQEKLHLLDPDRLKEIDEKNPRRLIRAIEIATKLGEVPKVKEEEICDSFLIGLELPKEKLQKRIGESVEKRMKKGMIEEVANLLDEGVSPEWLSEIGLTYRIIADYLSQHSNILKNVGMLSDGEKEKLSEKIKTAEWQYAKRQMTWFKRDKDIWWVSSENLKKIEGRVEEFLN